MKFCTLFLLLITGFIAKAQQIFLGISYDTVIMYEYDGGKGGDMSIVDDKGNFAKSLSRQVVLDNKTISELNTKLTQKESFGSGEAGCYNPRLGFVYFLNKNIVAKIDICLECNRLVSSFDLKAQKQGKLESEGEIYYLQKGMSKEFSNWLNNLVKSEGFQFSY
ncbi:hypothetical protein [Flavobacterium rhizosphaerae]|uniref:Uncharacterized protein n=1 Tax=Flavobacterium rhizosphaerae TaxID=3163298 RepID=A0ABW8YYJ7_9FLAO